MKEGKCLSCPENCEVCGSPNCTRCNPGFVVVDGKCVSCDVANCRECVEGDPKKCKNCNEGYSVIGTDQSKCTKCETPNCDTCSEANLFFFMNANQKCKSCLPSYYLNNNTQCEKCEVENCAECSSNSTECERCVPGYYNVNSTSPCIKCENRFYKCLVCSREKCHVCPAKFIPFYNCLDLNKFIPHCEEIGDKECNKCEQGYFLYSGVNCLKSVDNCIKYNTTGCVECQKGLILSKSRDRCSKNSSGFITFSAFILLLGLLFI